MEDQKQPVLDWVHLPAGVDEVSLWDSLHDAHLVRVASDRLARTVRLEFDISHLRKFHQLSEGLTFIFLLTSVKSVRVVGGTSWPGEFSIPQGVSREVESKLIAEVQAKFREESVSWDEFESKLSEGKNAADVYEAKFSSNDEGHFALTMLLHLDDENYPEVFLRSEGFEISKSDGERLTIEQFMRLGEIYWEDFATRGRARRAIEAAQLEE